MNAIQDRDRDVSDFREQRVDDREISLGTGTILGIFFALALLCAVFFGFGYSMGRKSLQTAAVPSNNGASSSSIFGGLKPSPGSPTSPSGSSTPSKRALGADSDATPSRTDAMAPDTSYTMKQPAAASQAAVASPAEGTAATVVVKASPRPFPEPAQAPPSAMAMPQTAPNGTAMVQVAAVSHQEDADLLLSALKKRGYAVFIRQEAQDRLLHVQIGPFATRKDADVMRQRLLADGYNAIVK